VGDGPIRIRLGEDHAAGKNNSPPRRGGAKRGFNCIQLLN
jgi:hypothetical protein